MGLSLSMEHALHGFILASTCSQDGCSLHHLTHLHLSLSLASTPFTKRNLLKILKMRVKADKMLLNSKLLEIKWKFPATVISNKNHYQNASTSTSILSPSWTHLGPILGPSWAHLGLILTPILGLSWALGGLCWIHLDPILGLSRAHFDHVDPHLGPILGSSWVHLGGLWAHLGGHLGHVSNSIH